MTNRDAINILEEVMMLDDTMYAYNPSYLGALDMAITALEAEETWYATHEYPPKTRWIPCSERLPEDGQNVLVTYKTTDKIHPCQYHDDGSRNPWYSYIDQCRAHMNVVLAWMPIPEPYREEGD